MTGYEAVIGRRIYPDLADHGAMKFSEGDYGKNIYGRWMARPPGSYLGDLSNHEVVEHEDGTITVSPSILIDAGPERGQWHGYLERGVWRTV